MTSTNCSNKALCGSCPWSESPYEEQIQRKLSEINASFLNHSVPVTCNIIHPSPKIAHYRNRMDFVINFQGKVGLREKGKWWSVIDNHTCFISDEKIEEVFSNIRTWVQSSGFSFFDRKKITGFLRYAVVRSSLNGDILITIITSLPSTPEEQSADLKLKDLAISSGTKSLVWGINKTVSDTSVADEYRIIYGEGLIRETIGGNTYRVGPTSFFQTNSHASPLLLETARKFASSSDKERFLDLFCGSGFFTLGLSAIFKNASGVELVEDSVRDAKLNAEENGRQVTFTASKSEEIDINELEPTFVLVDPPRAGLHPKTLADLCSGSFKDLLYVSCNHKAFARELETLQNYFSIEAMEAVDLFPHTPHVELVTLLRRKPTLI